MDPIDCFDLYKDGIHYDLQNKDVVKVSFYLRQITKYGEPVLELACRTGRITIPLASKGIKITGLDISEPMLEQARKKDRGKVEWIRTDCRNFHLSEIPLPKSKILEWASCFQDQTCRN